MRTPVALIIFNRPDTTEQVFARIAAAKPEKLFLIADGPRRDRPGEAQKCAAARAVVERIDWDCDVVRNYAEVNLGCGRRPASGISWVFDQVDEAIILEDDCVPDPTFFPFCAELLERYRDDQRVMHISGNNFHFGRKKLPYSYAFSVHNLSWGWATWRRAWKHHDMAVRLWPSLRDRPWLVETVGDIRAARFYEGVFDRAFREDGHVDYWDYQWTFACWAQKGLSILPAVTLISNIGYGGDATHMHGVDRRAHLTTEAIAFPLAHPPSVTRDTELDRIIIEEVLIPVLSSEPDLSDTLRRICGRMIPRHIRRSLSSLMARFVAN